MLYQIIVPYATFGLEVQDGVIIRAAPIAKWSVGKPIERVLSYYERRYPMTQWQRIAGEEEGRVKHAIYRLVTVHAQPVGDGADWMHGKDGRWYKAETPEQFAKFADAQEALYRRGLDETRVRVVAWPSNWEENT